MKKEVKTNNKGFSLVELIVVVAIMAVLMVVLAPAMLRYVEKTRAGKDEDAASEVRHAFELALADDEIYGLVSAGSALPTVTITSDGAGSATVSVTNDVTGNLIANEIYKTIGGTAGSGTAAAVPSFKVASKKYNDSGSKCVFNVEYDSNREVYIIKGTGTDPEKIDWKK